MSTKFIFVTGGVVSSLGKGITAASLGNLLKSRGLSVYMQKLDPYINVDPANLSPLQHGEIFVTEDGAECDLDIGHYERFISEKFNKYSDHTTGRIYWSVLQQERKGAFGGGTVQVIPHITNEIKRRITFNATQEDCADVVITEIGGTVGDIESLPYLEAIRQLKRDLGSENVMYIHVTLLPYLEKAGELKTKPTQHSVKELRSVGIQPDFIVCRSSVCIPDDVKQKIALFCDVMPENVISNPDCATLYEVPLLMHKEKLDDKVIKMLKLKCDKADLTQWEQMVKHIKTKREKVKIALIGKYTELPDAYLSCVEALNHAGYDGSADVDIDWILSSDFDNATIEEIGERLKDCSGILVPGGFGERGIDGMTNAITYARENHIPFLGIGIGQQLAAVEFARNVLNLKDAASTEQNPETKNPVVIMIENTPEINFDEEIFSNMRLGNFPCRLVDNTKAKNIYGNKELIHERHRNKYAINNKYEEKLEKAGFVISGVNPDDGIIEIIELQGHPFFMGVLYHAEFNSIPTNPHPLFKKFVQASMDFKHQN